MSMQVKIQKTAKTRDIEIDIPKGTDWVARPDGKGGVVIKLAPKGPHVFTLAP